MKQARDSERVDRIQAVLREKGWDAIVCTRPMNVLLVSGYWPVIGNAIAVVTREGEVSVAVPEDESELADLGWADNVRTFEAGRPDKLRNIVSGALMAVLKPLRGGTIGYENEACMEPATYAGMNFYGETFHEIAGEALQVGTLVPATGVLSRLRATLTNRELNLVRRACSIAAGAFRAGVREMCPGVRETELAALMRADIGFNAPESSTRADGFVFCMSGPNSARAYAAYQRSSTRRMQPEDCVLVHCNSYLDGFWTDITRTYSLSEPAHGRRSMYEAVFEARAAGMDKIRPGVRARDVDAAVRRTMASHGFGKEFKHPTGHGIGFAAIDHRARPRIHAASDDVLETGMTFNIEPAIYVDGQCGLRHCDVVCVTRNGCEALTDFHSTIDELTVSKAWEEEACGSRVESVS